MNRTIYIDMDGVVADFNKYALHALKKDRPVTRYPDSDWVKLKDNERLYMHLEVMKDAYELVGYCEQYVSHNPSSRVAFLTAVPRNNDMQWAFNDKVVWANTYFPNIPVFFGPFSHDKYKHCKGPNDILIDDRESNIFDWVTAGGQAYRYNNWPDCKQWLDYIFMCEGMYVNDGL